MRSRKTERIMFRCNASRRIRFTSKGDHYEFIHRHDLSRGSPTMRLLLLGGVPMHLMLSAAAGGLEHSTAGMNDLRRERENVGFVPAKLAVRITVRK